MSKLLKILQLNSQLEKSCAKLSRMNVSQDISLKMFVCANVNFA